MYILAIETTGPQLSVAIINDIGDIVELAAEEGMNHLQNLAPMIEELTKSCGVALADASAIAVSAGPGSFTGIRIGVSTVRALAQALNVKTVAVPTLASFAYHVPDYRGVICPVFDARRSQVYAGAYLWTGGSLLEAGEAAAGAPRAEEIVRGGAYDLDEYLSMLDQALKIYGQRELMLFGDGIRPYGERIAAWAAEKGYSFYDARMLVGNPDVNGVIRPASSVQTAASVARLGMEMYKEGKLLEYGQLTPEYMRKAEAERRLEAGLLGKKADGRKKE